MMPLYALVRKLHDSKQRRQALPDGKGDAGPVGQAHQLRQAHAPLPSENERRQIALMQAAVLDALPARAALLDGQGIIVSVNSNRADPSCFESGWLPIDFGLGRNYPLGWEAVVGHGQDDAKSISEGIRSVLEGTCASFSIEFACHPPGVSSESRRWLQITATPMHAEIGGGAVVMHMDISDRKRVEEELRRGRSQLGIAGRLARVGAWSVDLSQDHVVWSDEVCAIHDMPPGSQPSFDEALAFYPREWLEVTKAAFAACAGQGTAYDLELEIVTAKGRPLWVRSIAEAMRDVGGSICGVQGAFQDISDRKHAEQEAHRLARRLTTTLESVTAAFYTVDADWRFTYINSAAERLFGVPRSELIGLDLWERFPSLRNTPFEEAYRRALAENLPVSLEVHCEAWNGWFHASAYPSAEGLVLYVRDTTAERTSNRELRLLQAGVARLNDMVLVTEARPLDRPGPRIQFVNEAFERITGYTQEEMIGQSPRMLQGPLTDRTELDRIRAALSRFEPVRAELWNYTKAGQPYWIELDIVPVAVDGSEQSHFVAIQRDVTERKRDRDALNELNAELEIRVLSRTAELSQAREDADQANRAKSAFLATMSHEIRTPMNGVIGMIEVLHQTSLKGHQVEMVTLIRDSAFTLLRIIDDILDFSKMEAGKLTIEREPMRLFDVIEQVCALLDHIARRQDVLLTVFVDPAIPLILVGDDIRLRQILVNLIGNAIKFSSGHDRIGRVSMRAVLVEQAPDSVLIDLLVADNGIGIDDAVRERLFSPFEQADASTTRRFGGTGLGLAITSALVRLMGGEISVQSRLGMGSTFGVRLRLPTADNDDGQVASDRPLAGLRCRIIGIESPLAEDIGAYLMHAGAVVDHLRDLASAAGLRQAPGLWLWLLLPDQSSVTIDELRAMTPGRPEIDTRFVVLGRGKRRRFRVETTDLVSIDVGALLLRTLVKVLSQVAGLASWEGGDEELLIADVARVPRVSQARREGRLILVADDNDTNRKVILQQLELLGFAAEVVANGREALESWRSGEFALLMTDLHMPEMDGYELTAAIRSAEGSKGRRTPVIALTANALRDEEIRCRAVGMDAFLTKPVRLPQLRATIDEWLRPLDSAHSETETQPGDAAMSADLKVLEGMIGSDPVMIEQVLQAFRDSASRSELAVTRGALTGAMDEVAEAVHMLKSGARAIGAWRLGSACDDIEDAARAGQTDEVDLLLPAFREALASVLNYLKHQ